MKKLESSGLKLKVETSKELTPEQTEVVNGGLASGSGLKCAAARTSAGSTIVPGDYSAFTYNYWG